MVLVFLILSKSMIHKQAYGHPVSPCFQNAAGSHPITTQTEVEFFHPGIQFSFFKHRTIYMFQMAGLGLLCLTVSCTLAAAMTVLRFYVPLNPLIREQTSGA